MKTPVFILLLLLPIVGFSQKETIITSGNSKLCYKTFGEGAPILIIKSVECYASKIKPAV